MNWTEHFYYDESSPTGLRRAKDWVSGMKHQIIKAYKGDVAGSLTQTDGYFVVKVNGTSFRVHRVIWEMFNDKISKGMQIDHLDRNRTNNLISNLRLVSSVVNSRNQSFRSTNTSGVCGVGLLINKTKSGENRYWKAQWNDLNGKRKAKCFSIELHGEDESFKLACEYRTNIMQKLNEDKAGYTPDHGIKHDTLQTL
jgi:hypothetical protein